MLEIAGPPSRLSHSKLCPRRAPFKFTTENGAAMSILKKCDAKNHLSAIRNRSRHSLRPPGQADRAKPSEIKPDGLRASRLTFVEDFIREHSLPGVHISSIEISGSF